MARQKVDMDARTRLLEAGAALFAEKGFKGASVREICDQAGTGNNMIHHYFGSKKGLLHVLMDQFSSEIFTVPIRIIQKLPDSRDEFVSRFVLFVEETLEALIANRYLFALVQREEVQQEHGPFIIYAQTFIDYINHGKNSGFVNSTIDPAMLTGLVMDRLGNQVLYAKVIQKSTGADVISDADYKARWLRANLDLFLYGFIAP